MQMRGFRLTQVQITQDFQEEITVFQEQNLEIPASSGSLGQTSGDNLLQQLSSHLAQLRRRKA